MHNLIKKILFFIFLSLYFSKAFGEIVNKIEIFENERISNETIKMFADVSIEQDLNQNEINKILKNLYDSNFFDDVEISLKKMF